MCQTELALRSWSPHRHLTWSRSLLVLVLPRTLWPLRWPSALLASPGTGVARAALEPHLGERDSNPAGHMRTAHRLKLESPKSNQRRREELGLETFLLAWRGKCTVR